MYKNKTILQIGSHIVNSLNDPIFKDIDETTKIILVEPVPHLFDQLKINYKKKLTNLKNVTFIKKAVSNFVGEVELSIPSERNDFSRLPFWASQLASIDPTHIDKAINHLIIDKIKVKTTTIDEIIKENNITDIDLLHTDTEGHDYTILMNYSFTIKPQKILFEHCHMDGFLTIGDKYIELTNKLLSLGYKKKYQDTEDTMFEL